MGEKSSNCLNFDISETVAQTIQNEIFKSSACKKAVSTITTTTDYNMKHLNRGYAVILNHEVFDKNLKLKPRPGTNIDALNLRNAFGKLNFSIVEMKDASYMELYHELERIANLDHSNNDCIAIVVLSHGDFGKIYARDTYYHLDDLIDLFTAGNCVGLTAKPKLFFVQACQGERFDNGIPIPQSEEIRSATNKRNLTIPNRADFLVCQSTIPGFCSWRNSMDGSWFMQALCQELNGKNEEKTGDDLMSLMTRVNWRVATNFESFDLDDDITTVKCNKQIPSTFSTLTRKVKF